uniref:Restriction of telomere capping protein 4 n=1 Tax=Mycena chlorophos TaxID=658473 RepID=A0ABQ0LAS7_MYCCL|nr:predicted protein [Mycena chlorophos]
MILFAVYQVESAAAALPSLIREGCLAQLDVIQAGRWHRWVLHALDLVAPLPPPPSCHRQLESLMAPRRHLEREPPERIHELENHIFARMLENCSSPDENKPCKSKMGPVRALKGSKQSERRGEIVQSCANRTCHSTISFEIDGHYLSQDVDAMWQRLKARREGSVVDPRCANAPLRIICVPSMPRPDATGKIKCANPSCSGQGAKNCIEFFCRSCCRRVASVGKEVRDACKIHDADQVRDDDVGVPAAPIPQPSNGRGRGRTAAQPQQPAVEPVRRGQPLAQPLGPLWVPNQVLPGQPLAMVPNAKGTKAALDEEVKKKVQFVVWGKKSTPYTKIDEVVESYPGAKLETLTGIMTMLQLTPTGRFDYFNHSTHEWINTSVSTPITVNTARPTLIRLRQSLFDAWTDDDCPGFNDVISRKRPAESSPERASSSKAPKPILDIDAARAARAQLPLPQARPPPPPLAPFATPVPNAVLQPVVAQPVAPPIPVPPPVLNPAAAVNLSEVNFGKYTAADWDQRWKQVKVLQDTRPEYRHEKDAFPVAFRRPYKRSTHHNYKTPWDAIPEHVRERYIAMGNHPDAPTLDQIFIREGVAWMKGLNKTAIASRLAAISSTPALTTTTPVAPAAPPPPPLLPASDRSSGDLAVNAHELNNDIDQLLGHLFGWCEICDEPYRADPSEKLQQMLRKLEAEPSPVMKQTCCKQHRAEGAIVMSSPSGAPFPQTINYAGLFIRLEKHLDELQDIAGEHSKPFVPIHGYFGFCGYTAIVRDLQRMFSGFDTFLDASEYAPLDFKQLIEQVIVPEAMLLLIKDDFEPQDDASTILRTSSDFGALFHSDAWDRQRAVDRSDDEPPALRVPTAAVPPVVAQQLAPHPPSPKPVQQQQQRDIAPPLAPQPFPMANVAPVRPPIDLDALLRIDDEPVIKTEPAVLCAFCDQPLPKSPSDTLTRLGAELHAKSRPDPTVENSGHRLMPHQQYSSYCARHRFERETLPLAVREGWPQAPDFDGLMERVLSMAGDLRELLAEPENSSFFRDAAKHYDGASKLKMTAMSVQFQHIDRLQKLGPGYYGEIGLYIVQKLLHVLFPDALHQPQSTTTFPYAILVNEVLAPEVFVRLVQQDMHVNGVRAKSILERSYPLGSVLHPECENSATEAVDRYIFLRHADPDYKLWVEAETDLGLEEWVSERLVKEEPKEGLVPKSGPMVIDLTLDEDEE